MSNGRVQARIDPQLQVQAEAIIKNYGFSTSKLITVIYYYIVKTNCLDSQARLFGNHFFT